MSHDVDDAQTSVDKMAAALRAMEESIINAINKAATVTKQIDKFRCGCEVHPSKLGDTYTAAASVSGQLAYSLDAADRLHTVMEELCANENPPLPLPSPQGGGGGGK